MSDAKEDYRIQAYSNRFKGFHDSIKGKSSLDTTTCPNLHVAEGLMESRESPWGFLDISWIDQTYYLEKPK